MKKNKIVAILEMIPFILIMILSIGASLNGVNCARGLSWKTCDFFEGVTKILTLFFPFTIS
ncbi:MAG: hypothetical protein K2M17_02635 [Bacilli bacterium]|nr:hypothetical protein [Bacilli bacterium]